MKLPLLKKKVDHLHKEEHFCGVEGCSLPLKETLYVWDSSLSDYVLVGDDGIPQKDKRLDEDGWKALEKGI